MITWKGDESLRAVNRNHYRKYDGQVLSALVMAKKQEK